GRLRIDLVRAAGQAVGFVLSLEDPVARRMEALKSEFTLDSAGLFPGWQLFVRMAREGAEAGFRMIDQGTYRTGFKEQWSDRLDRRVQVRVPSPGLGGAVYGLIRGRVVPLLMKRLA